jgi:hypothetical protein
MTSKVKIALGSRPALLQIAMKKNQPFFSINIEKDSCGTIAQKIHPEFMQTVSHRTRERHAHGPTELERHEPASDLAPILTLKT